MNAYVTVDHDVPAAAGNTDATEFGGSGVGNYGSVTAAEEPWQGRPASVEITLPPLGGLWLAPRA